MDSFLILGHGIEEIIPFEDRKEIPEGVILVTLEQCGIVTTTKDVCPITEAFSKEVNRKIFSNPVKYKEEIEAFLGGKEIHIYEKDQKYPNLLIQMFLDWNLDDYVKIMKSGVYKFPISEKEFRLGLCSDFCDALFKKIGPYESMQSRIPKDFKAKDMFHGSIYPTTAEVNEKIAEVSAMKGIFNSQAGALQKSLTVTLEKVFEKGGPGVYYYVVCRHPKNITAPKNFIENNLQLVDPTNFKRFYDKDWITKLDELIPLLEAEMKKMRNKGGYPNLNEIQSKLNNYKKLRLVPRIRRMSLNQQALRSRKVNNRPAAAGANAPAAAGPAAAGAGSGANVGGKRRRKTLRKRKARTRAV